MFMSVCPWFVGPGSLQYIMVEECECLVTFLPDSQETEKEEPWRPNVSCKELSNYQTPFH